MKKIEFGLISFHGNSILIEETKVPEKSEARNIEVSYEKENCLYSVKAEINRKIFVCSQENYEKKDIFICEVEENQEIDDDFIKSLKNDLLDAIECSENDFYIDHRKNQYTGDRNFFLFLKKGSYKSKEISKVEYFTSNILIK